MTPSNSIPLLHQGWESTRATLHAYARILGTVARAHAIPDRRWWHVSLSPTAPALMTDPIPSPSGEVTLGLDLTQHAALVFVDGAVVARQALGAAIDTTAFSRWLYRAVGGLGLEDRYDRSRFDAMEVAAYNPAAAATFAATLEVVQGIFEVHRDSLPGSAGPIQLWPHGFDLAFEWFGTRMVEGESGHPVPAQLNLGWYPGGDAYFYSTPWPFDAALLERPLPHGAVWHTDGWIGARLEHALVADRSDGSRRVMEFAREVFTISEPTLSR